MNDYCKSPELAMQRGKEEGMLEVRLEFLINDVNCVNGYCKLKLAPQRGVCWR